MQKKPDFCQIQEKIKKEKGLFIQKKYSPTDSLGQRFKKNQSEREELLRIIKNAITVADQFQKNPEPNSKVKIALEMIEQASFKLNYGVDNYLKDYLLLRGSEDNFNTVDAEEKSIINVLESWTCSDGMKLKKEFDSLKTVFDEESFFNAVEQKVNINVVIKDAQGNIFGFHVSMAPSQKNVAVVDKTHFIFSIRNMNKTGALERQFFPKKLVESFVVFNNSCYIFCVPYAFAIGPTGKSAISPKLETIYLCKDNKTPCSFGDINGTSLPRTFPIEWVKVFVQ